MKLFTLRSVVDDILLMIRNNNVSESEDFSRAQIILWVLSYKAALLKRKADKEKASGQESEDEDDTLIRTIGPLELVDVKPLDNTCLYTKRTKDKLPELSGSSDSSIISVQDQEGYPLQNMNEKRRHFQYFRKYTFGDMTWRYENEYVYIQGMIDLNRLRYIWITGSFADGDSADADEDDVTIPGWMIPDIRQMIMTNELKFVLNMPSDDTNNSTLQGIKPKGQTNENEK